MESHYTYVGQLVTATGEPINQGSMLNASAFSLQKMADLPQK
ncbi:hypothetical protein [Rahnella aquatilis]|nr:hypothetical protein [Rahnella aquatilis]